MIAFEGLTWLQILFFTSIAVVLGNWACLPGYGIMVYITSTVIITTCYIWVRQLLYWQRPALCPAFVLA